VCVLTERAEEGTVFGFLQQNEDWDMVKLVEIPVWIGETDSLLFYERKVKN
jgi:hypothetical protein